MELLQNPVIIAILSALCGAFIAWFFFRIEKFKISREMKKLKEHLANQLEITAEGTKSWKDNIEKLKKENENLRVSIQSYQQKPDRKEIRMLYVYDKAISNLIENAPGFGPMWVKALKEAEVEMSKTESGLIAFTKNLLGLKAPQKLGAYKQYSDGDSVENAEIITEDGEKDKNVSENL
jgi:phosphate/sulfate permease